VSQATLSKIKECIQANAFKERMQDRAEAVLKKRKKNEI